MSGVTPVPGHGHHLSVDPDGLRTVGTQLGALAERLAGLMASRPELVGIRPAGRDEVSTAVAGAFNRIGAQAGDELAAGAAQIRALGAALIGRATTFEEAEADGAAGIAASGRNR